MAPGSHDIISSRTSSAPHPSSPGVSARMARQARRDTKPELALRSALHRQGLRFRVDYHVPGMARRTIDVAFPGKKVALFVDGCFWHGCPLHGTYPTANADWWAEKIAANRRRDVETTEHLRGLGWQVLRLWEHDLPDGVGTAANLVRGG